MRKRIVEKQPATTTAGSHTGWMDLTQIATVEVTSEDSAFPIESVFTASGPGWRAGQAGAAFIRLRYLGSSLFRCAVSNSDLKSQRWRERSNSSYARSAAGGTSTEIVRQQWNFSPHGATTEVEDYTVHLESVSVLELSIRPDISGGNAIASLAAFYVV